MAKANELRSHIRGEVIVDGAAYDQHRRVHNAMHDCRPDVIVRCIDAADVVAAVDHARARELEVAIRGGGHSVPGYGTCDGGVVIDLSRWTTSNRPDEGGRACRGRRDLGAASTTPPTTPSPSTKMGTGTQASYGDPLR